jgi:two-component system, NtrC family, response regulator AtoC
VSGKEKILIVEDEKLIRWSLGERLQKDGYETHAVDTGQAALDYLREEDADLVLLDYKLPDISGMEVLRRAVELYPDTTVILMTAYSSIHNAVEAIKLGAYDYVNKPFDHEELLASIQKALETTRLRREVKRLRSEQKNAYGVSSIIGRSAAMQDVFTMIRKVAESAATTVLIQGESGTGKDLVAKAIHFASDRSDKPFMNITCSALPESLLESELFGHERGAFTDAKLQKKGLLEMAGGGTVFLDEIGDMGLALQAKLLRFLEEKTFKRVGGTRDIRVDVRIIAATNRELERVVREGTFREDLYYRLKVIPIHLPPLKARKGDIPHLVAFFLDQFNREFKKNTHGIDAEALDCLMRYDWPGNIRELRNMIERTMILENKPQVEIQDLPREIALASEGRAATSPSPETAAVRAADDDGADGAFRLPETGVTLEEVERDLVKQAVERTQGNQTHAARLLNISRDALRYKMKKFGLL